MRGLTIIVSTADAGRLHAPLSLALANAALGAETRIFFNGLAVLLLNPSSRYDEDEQYRTVGMPTLQELLSEAAASGVRLFACQTGLGLAALQADELPSTVEIGGLIELLATAGEDRLLMV